MKFMITFVDSDNKKKVRTVNATSHFSAAEKINNEFKNCVIISNVAMAKLIKSRNIKPNVSWAMKSLSLNKKFEEK